MRQPNEKSASIITKIQEKAVIILGACDEKRETLEKIVTMGKAGGRRGRRGRRTTEETC